MMLLSNLRSGYKKVAPFSWILVNSLGYYVANLDHLLHILQSYNIHPNLILICFYTINSWLSGLIFGLLQLGYLKIFCKTLKVPYYVLKTVLSFFLVNLVNGYLFLFLLSLFITKTHNADFSYSIGFNSGIAITGSSEILAKVLIALLIGALMGLWTGFILGFFPALSFPDKKIAREWILRVTVSGCIGFMLNSVVFTIACHQNPTGIHLGDLYRIGLLIIGFIYGLLTRNTVKKLMITNNCGSE